MREWRYRRGCGSLAQCETLRQHQRSECEDQSSHDRGRLNDLFIG
jgi:hypothetical protein